MKSIFRHLLLITGLLSVTSLHAAQDLSLTFFNQSLGDFSEELIEARDQGKKGILLFFEMDECPFCHRMKTTVLNQPKVQKFFRDNFLIFPIDIEGDIEITDFSGNTVKMKDFAYKFNRVRATPVFAFFNLEGQKVARYTGPTSGVDEFMWLGEYVVNEEYKKMKFTKYKRQKKKQQKSGNH